MASVPSLLQFIKRKDGGIGESSRQRKRGKKAFSTEQANDMLHWSVAYKTFVCNKILE